MKYLIDALSKVLFNPISLAILILHWGLFLVFFPRQELLSYSFHVAHEHIVTYVLLVLDLPSLVLTAILTLPFYYAAQAFQFDSLFLYYILGSFLVSFQWGGNPCKEGESYF